MIHRRLILACIALASCGLASAPCRAAGSQPYAFVSILGGQDVPGCGTQIAPCRTAQYAHDFVIRPGGETYVQDLGHFGEPSIVTAIGIAGAKISDYSW